ncbi:zonadhesin-like [Nilaparvata lugens]|uniref:zonadhesin-like n=1 Tax=Nilaparvata lugens TaxID=108931 RepID=UPI00193EB390|nr:zonadhesin-like [Nilaparvata lugens]
MKWGRNCVTKSTAHMICVTVSTHHSHRWISLKQLLQSQSRCAHPTVNMGCQQHLHPVLQSAIAPADPESPCPCGDCIFVMSVRWSVEPLTIATSRPTIAASRPTIATSRPTIATSRPTIATSRPTIATSRPTIAASRPTIAASRPTIAASQPTTATNHPTS